MRGIKREDGKGERKESRSERLKRRAARGKDI